jgi:tetratricopeptide (TPR) repeat protein
MYMRNTSPRKFGGQGRSVGRRVLVLALCAVSLIWSQAFLIGFALAEGQVAASAKVRQFLQEGIEALKAGKLDEAARDFEKAAEMDPSNPYAYNNLGFTYMRMMRFRDAIGPFEKAVALRPNSAVFHYNLARAFELAKNYPKAISYYEKTVALDPTHALAHFRLGKLYGREQQRYPEAIEELKKALKLDPKIPEAHYSLAVAYFGVNNFAEAWKEVRKAQELGFNVNPAFLKALRQKMPKPP